MSKPIPSVVLRGSRDKEWKFVFVEPRQVAELVGHRLLAAFLKCFVGVDRLLRLEHLLSLNLKVHQEDSPSYARNLRLIVQLLGATVYELASAIQEAGSARVVEKMSDASKWEPLDQRRRKWRGDARLAKFRNQLGHHLGESDVYDAGLKEVLSEAGSELVFEEGVGRLRHDGECVLAGDVLLRGLTIGENDIRDVIALTHEAHSGLPDELVAAFTDVLESSGIAIVDESEADR